MDKDKHLEQLTDLLSEVSQSLKDNAGKEVEIEHCINIKKMCDYKVSCSYRDIVFVICIIKEYLKLMEGKEGCMWGDYYREQFAKLADKLAAQIQYDYEKQMEKCRRKMGTKTAEDDIGGEAMALAVQRGKR